MKSLDGFGGSTGSELPLHILESTPTTPATATAITDTTATQSGYDTDF